MSYGMYSLYTVSTVSKLNPVVNATYSSKRRCPYLCQSNVQVLVKALVSNRGEERSGMEEHTCSWLSLQSIKHWFTNKRDKEARHKLKSLAGSSINPDGNNNSSVNSNCSGSGSNRVHDRIIQNGRIDDGEAVFRSLNKDQIEAHAKNIEGETEEAKLKKALKELWAAQNDSAKALFEEQAKASWNITRN
ncbi:hypothetical protein K435DRAFT_793739 [Dendrothele bispora CBS 962.96]|uniref:Uncharacterized protein n=1 Tax=Dendrothele bispora (strain CBS 962.96) TaxID=1314807 RepID=A0A4S8MEU4_DENBC|nr:hypothetical protein K435DRAFT_793739 [Dendrothele bispora CBS 962.96]